MEDVVTVNKLDFLEVKKDIDLTTAHNLSSKCLNCKNPRCVTGCPLGINIPEFISLIKENKYEEAYEKISEKSVMPEVCGRVCPQEKTCQAKCIRGLNGESVRIGDLERFVSNYKKENFNISENGKKVAVIGSGPASLSCAYHLRRAGFKITVFEASHKYGGVLTYGIPNFRLPKDIVNNVIFKLEHMGVIFKNDTLVGKTITIKELKKDFDYIFIGTGAGVPKTLDIEGIMAKNVMSANELLTRINLMNAPFSDTPLNIPRKAIIIGGGNVACDAARCLVRLGAYVTICYRKDENNLKMRQEEYKHALKEGVEFEFEMVPKEIKYDEDYSVKSVIFTCNDTEKELKCDGLIIAIGTTHNDIILRSSNIKTNEKHQIITKESMTSDKIIFAGGDVLRGNATVIDALSDGLEAANKIIEISKQKEV